MQCQRDYVNWKQSHVLDNRDFVWKGLQKPDELRVGTPVTESRVRDGLPAVVDVHHWGFTGFVGKEASIVVQSEK